MTTAQLDHFRERLRDMARRVKRDVDAVSEQAKMPSGGQAAGELSNVPMHLGDMGTEEYLHDLNATLLENEQYLVDEALAALARIDDGTFGRCENCESEIPDERLEAIPYARHCTRCAESLQNGHKANFNSGRPQSPADTFAPEGDLGDNRRPVLQAPPSDQTPAPQTATTDGDAEPGDFT